MTANIRPPQPSEQSNASGTMSEDLNKAKANVAAALQAIVDEDFTASIELLSEVLEIEPRHPVALHVMGLVAIRLSEPGRAIDLFKAAHELDPNCREHCDALAIVYAMVGNLQESLFHGKLSTALPPNEEFPGLLPEWLGDFQTHFTAIEKSPLVTVGNALATQGRFIDAAESFRKAVEINSKEVDAWRGLARALRFAFRPHEAQVAFEALASLCPDEVDDMSAMALNLTQLGAFEEARTLHVSAVQKAETRADLYSTMIHDRRFDPAFDVQSLADAEKAWAEVFSFEPLPPVDRSGDVAPRKMRLGVVSSRFRAGTELDLFWTMLQSSGGSSVDIYCYSNNPYNDVLTRGVQGAVQRWLDVQEIDDETLATIIRNDAIDVLVDMDGHREYGRPQLFTMRPAACAVRFLGLPEAAEAQGFDGVLGDAFTYDETVENAIRVDGGLFPVPEIRGDGFVRDHLADHPTIFGTAASRAQINQTVLGVWGEILLRVESSTLLLNPSWLGGVDIANDLRRAFEAQGLGDRIEIMKPTKDLETDVRTYCRSLDVLLEPFPMPSLNHVWDGINVGLPILGLAGDDPASRAMTGVMGQLGLHKLIADSEEKYVAQAIELANDAEARRSCAAVMADATAGRIERLSPRSRLLALSDALIAFYRRHT